MLQDCPAEFEREMGCTAAELGHWLPGAAAPHPVRTQPNGADIDIDAGCLRLRWEALAPRRIALLSVPRLQLRFAFEGVDEAARVRFMRRFDLYTQRGGG
ncbi:hypothetical protein [Azohydromonas aeria]|uniref:hypothetical protein n=1 Tax=Azohydromonas aeria TaxID=2590212 RepID=UPI001E533208|nr:hypothetical protein [Azohydromonas aeria]